MCIKRLFWPPMGPKNEIRFSANSSYWFIRAMTQVYKTDISLTFTVAMVTKWPSKQAEIRQIDHFGANLSRLTAQLI